MSRKVLLIVDDDDRTMQLIEPLLGTEYDVLRVSHGRRATGLAGKGRIALALISQCLPDMDGLDVLRDLQEKLPSVNLIFLGESLTKECVISAFRLGARDVLEKPLDEHSLRESINRVLGEDEKIQKRPTQVARDPPASGVKRTFVDFLRNYASFDNLRLRSFASCLKPTALRSPVKSRETEKATFTNTESKPPEDLSPRLGAYCFGGFKVVLRDKVIKHWPSRKGKTIFAYLVYNHKRRIYRDVLVEKFWPSSSPDCARNCLNVTLHGIRRDLHGIDRIHEYILFKDECYFMNPEVEIWLDVDEFLRYWRVGQSLERQGRVEAAMIEYEFAVANYRGDFMEEDLYETWPSLERENLKEIYLLVLDRLSRHYSLDGKSETAIDLCELILAKDDCREDVHRRLMKCYHRIGQRDRALRQFNKCVEILRAELEVEPTRETRELYEQLRQDFLVLEKESDEFK